MGWRRGYSPWQWWWWGDDAITSKNGENEMMMLLSVLFVCDFEWRSHCDRFVIREMLVFVVVNRSDTLLLAHSYDCKDDVWAAKCLGATTWSLKRQKKPSHLITASFQWHCVNLPLSSLCCWPEKRWSDERNRSSFERLCWHRRRNCEYEFYNIT